jgi:hypothetical protein
VLLPLEPLYQPYINNIKDMRFDEYSKAMSIKTRNSSTELGTPMLKYQEENQAPMAHAYNPSYSGGRDQEDHSSKPAQTNGLETLFQKKTHHKKKKKKKKRPGEWLKV